MFFVFSKGIIVCKWHSAEFLFLLITLPSIISCAKHDSEPEKPAVFPGNVVYLDECANWNIPLESSDQPPGTSVQKLLLRQFCRQSLLIAAREELGLTTRDAAIGDSMPANKAEAVVLMGANNNGNQSVYVERSFDKAHLRSNFVFDGDYLNAAISAEKMSRKWCVEVLKKLGFPGKPNDRRSEAKVPADVESLLSQMTFTSQFQAIRLLHNAIKLNGESDELLGALVRGYANLGWLTEHHWLSDPDVFKARSILYAQRMLAEGKHPLWAKWHRAYALAALGLHAQALSDLESCEEILGSESSDNSTKTSLESRRPTWVKLIEAHCLFKLDDLDPNKAEKPHQQLAELLRLISLELSNGKDNRIHHVQTIMDATQSMPECYRAINSLCNHSGVGIGHISTVMGLKTLDQNICLRLAAMPELADNVRKIVDSDSTSKHVSLQPFTKIKQLIDALREVKYDNDNNDTNHKQEAEKKTFATPPTLNDPNNQKLQAEGKKDSGEPSWATLGRLIHETSFSQIWSRSRFLKEYLNVSADEFIDTASPLLENHSCRALVDVYRSALTGRQQALQSLTNMPTWNLNLWAGHVLPYFARIRGSQEAQEMARQMMQNTDCTAKGLTMIIPSIMQPHGQIIFSRELLKISPKNPYSRGHLVKLDWKNVADFIEQWERDATGRNAYVLHRLGEKYMELKQYDDAKRCYQAAINVSPDIDTHRALSNIYKLQGETDKSIEILEDFLDQPSYGLEHSVIRVEIADHYKAIGDWEKALKYSEKAAESYSCRSLRSAAGCHERLAHWNDAEQYYKAIANRYQQSRLIWYCYCRRTGKGDLKDATELAKTCVDEVVELNNVKAFNVPGIFCAFNGKTRESLDYFKKHFDSCWDNYEGMHAALAADESGEVALRDEVLKEIERRGEWREKNGKYNDDVTRQLAKLMAEDLKRGGKADFDPGDYDKIVKNCSEQIRMNSHYFIAKYLELRGNEDMAINYWKRCLASYYMFGWNRSLAGAELIKRGYKADCYKKTASDEKQLPDEKDAGDMIKKGKEHKETKKTKDLPQVTSVPS